MARGPLGEGAVIASVAMIRIYRATIGPLFAGACRFLPTCSRYTEEAIRLHGFWRGGLLGARRLLSCRPWGGSGYDPVPRPRPPASGAGVSRPSRCPVRPRPARRGAVTGRPVPGERIPSRRS